MGQMGSRPHLKANKGVFLTLKCQGFLATSITLIVKLVFAGLENGH